MSSKGSQWERDICKMLTEWASGQPKPLLWWRGQGSGGMFTRSGGSAGNNFSGDIYPIHEDGYFLSNIFSIEAKCGYKDASLDKHLKYNKADPIKSFWVQCTEDAKASEKEPLLIYKKHGLPTPWIGINEKIYKKLKKFLKGKRCIHLIWDELPDVFFFEIKEFLSCISAKDIKGLKL